MNILLPLVVGFFPALVTIGGEVVDGISNDGVVFVPRDGWSPGNEEFGRGNCHRLHVFRRIRSNACNVMNVIYQYLQCL